MAKKKGFFIQGLPINPRWKLLIVFILLIVLIAHKQLLVIFPNLSYPYNGLVNIALVSLMVLFSLGGLVAESLVIGLSVFAFSSNIWDSFVNDTSILRNHIFYGTLLLLIIVLTFGRISFSNLYIIIKRQLGAEKK